MSEILKKSKKIFSFKVVTYNVNFSHRAVGEYEGFSWANRKEHVMSFLKKQLGCGDPVWFNLQEVMEEYLEDILPLFKDTHDVFKQQVHPCGRCILTIVPKELNAEQIKLEKISDNHRQVFLGVSLEITKNDSFLFMNAHFPMAHDYKTEFGEELVKIKKKHKHMDNVMVTGDFNTFSDEGGYKHLIDIQNKGGMYDALQYMVTPDGTLASVTFNGYPYDKIPDVNPMPLDHIFISSKNSNLKHETPICDKVIAFEHMDGNFYGASDHSAIILDCEIELNPPKPDKIVFDKDFILKLYDMFGNSWSLSCVWNPFMILCDECDFEFRLPESRFGEDYILVKDILKKFHALNYKEKQFFMKLYVRVVETKGLEYTRSPESLGLLESLRENKMLLDLLVKLNK